MLLITLVALGLLMLAAAAIQTAVQTSTVLAGNLAFRRDLANQAERGIEAARTLLESGALVTEAGRQQHQLASNYSATQLPSLDSGIPTLLASDTAFTAGAMAAPDLSDNAVTVRFVIDRQCTAVGEFDVDRCESMTGASDAGGSNWLRKPGGESRPVYRITVRATGVRDIQVFLQSTFSY